MRLVRCDECHAEVPERGCGGDPAIANRVIRLEGYRNPKGDILLPEHLITHDFCSRECFESWMSRREGLNLLPDHKEKFKEFFRMVGEIRNDADMDTVVIYGPEVLGDNYAEVMANLSVLQEASLRLVMAL